VWKLLERNDFAKAVFFRKLSMKEELQRMLLLSVLWPGIKGRERCFPEGRILGFDVANLRHTGSVALLELVDDPSKRLCLVWKSR
jgi:hypothetical protein